MKETRVTLRIPGDWPHPGKLLGKLPDGFRLSPEALILPDGAEIEFIPWEPTSVTWWPTNAVPASRCWP